LPLILSFCFLRQQNDGQQQWVDLSMERDQLDQLMASYQDSMPSLRASKQRQVQQQVIKAPSPAAAAKQGPAAEAPSTASALSPLLSTPRPVGVGVQGLVAGRDEEEGKGGDLAGAFVEEADGHKLSKEDFEAAALAAAAEVAQANAALEAQQQEGEGAPEQPKATDEAAEAIGAEGVGRQAEEQAEKQAGEDDTYGDQTFEAMEESAAAADSSQADATVAAAASAEGGGGEMAKADKSLSLGNTGTRSSHDGSTMKAIKDDLEEFV
jgi:hypothetical protein